MRLYSYTNSERGKSSEKSGNDYLRVTLSVDRYIVGEVELYLNKDSEEYDDADDEWVVTFRKPYVTDPDIIAQGHTQVKVKTHAKRRKA